MKVAFRFPMTCYPSSSSTYQTDRKKYWCEKKREQRQKLSAQKKRRVKEKDRQRKAATRLEEKQRMEKLQESSFNSPKTRYNATYKARKSLPKSPRKFAEIVSGLVDNSSPRKRKELERKGIEPKSKSVCSAAFTEVLKKMKKKRAGMAAVKLVVQTAKKIKFRASQRLLSSKFGINRKTVGRAYHSTNNRAFRKDRLGQRDIQMVQQFYRTEHIARPLPQKRFATKHGPGYVLEITLKAAFRLFQKEHPSVNISYTKFTQLRPKNVRLLSAMKQEGCLCAYCMNVKYKLLSLNKLVAQGKLHQSLVVQF